jgi:hypothetical protein
MKKLIALAAGVALLTAFGCAKKPVQPQPPVDTGHYATHQYHGGKLSKMGN